MEYFYLPSKLGDAGLYPFESYAIHRTVSPLKEGTVVRYDND